MNFARKCSPSQAIQLRHQRNQPYAYWNVRGVVATWWKFRTNVLAQVSRFLWLSLLPLSLQNVYICLGLKWTPVVTRAETWANQNLFPFDLLDVQRHRLSYTGTIHYPTHQNSALRLRHFTVKPPLAKLLALIIAMLPPKFRLKFVSTQVCSIHADLWQRSLWILYTHM